MKKPNEYNHLALEKKWQKKWQESKTYKTEANSKKKKMYVLDMFPYPSGAGLHVGHPRGYIGSDVYARMKRMQGFNVLHPMGYDAFGLPAEQFAIANKIHPRKAVESNVKTFEKQMSIIGLSYDWSRKVNTTDPAYYKWTQWIFLQIYDAWYDTAKNKARTISELISIFEKKGNTAITAVTGNDIPEFSAKEWKGFGELKKQEVLMKYRLAYEGYSEVNWCPEMGTVLANDEIVDGPNGPVSERGGFPVVKKSMRQWFMRITAYADRLIQDLESLDWNEHIKEIQRNWIGRSEGSIIPFKFDTAEAKVPKQILVGTRNEAKFKMIKACFPEMAGVELISLNDIAEVDDSKLVEGQDFKANARMKAEFYFKATDIPTLSMDNVFWVEKWPKDDHVVIHMRKEAGNGNDKTSDEDVIAFFQKWLKKVGDSDAHFIFAIAYTDKNGTQETASTQRGYTFQSKRIKGDFWKGYPTECLLVDKETGVCKGNQTIAERYTNLITVLKKEIPLWLGVMPEKVEAFTTRADTLFGAFAVILAPEHGLIDQLRSHITNISEVDAYIAEAKKKDEAVRTADDKEKTGVALKGIYVINPVNGEKLPVWIADFVSAQYGTGAIFADTHDERDYQFAKKYNLPLRVSIEEKFVEEGKGESGIKPELPFIKRTAVAAIIRNPKNNTYLTTDWRQFNMHGLVTGGIEEGEDMVEAALREIHEETGYKNVKFVRDPNISLHSFFYHRHKKENRWARFRFVFFDLIDEERDAVDEKESAIHAIVWKTFPELKEYFTVIEGTRALTLINNPDYIFTGDGILIDSGEFTGMDSAEARLKITEFVGGKVVTKFKMRDAIFARQRYWGEPIPLKHDKAGIIQEVPIKKLPLELPNVTSYEPTGTGESPLGGVKSWTKEGYETNTMPGWAGSSWYFLRYMDPNNTKEFASKKSLAYWKDVDMYVGGAEHATGHLLYSRFWHKFLYDMGYVPMKEPFKTLRNQGMIGGADGRKMSKRWGNVVNPDDVIATYGADSLRVFEMFLGPFDSALPWSTEGIIGSRRFIEKVWRLGQKILTEQTSKTLTKTDPESEKILHKTIKKVSEDIASFNFNTAVSSMMICMNEFERSRAVSLKDFKLFLQILAPFASHVTEELWAELGEKKSIHISGWPKYNPKKLIEERIKIIVSINGKPRSELVVTPEMSEEEIKAEALKDTKIILHLEGKDVKRVIYVPGRLINIVI